MKGRVESSLQRWRFGLLVAILSIATPPVRSTPLGELLADLNRGYYTLGSSPEFLGTVGSKAVFATRGGANAFVWITDGTPEGTRPLEISTTSALHAPNLLALGTAGAHLFLLDRHGEPGDGALLAVDDRGTVTRVLEAGDTWDFCYFGSPSQFRVVGRRLALALSSPYIQDSDLAFVDGDTLAFEIALPATTGGLQLLGAIGDDLAFSRYDSETSTSSLWRSGGTADTTSQVATLLGVTEGDRAAAGDAVVYFPVHRVDAVGTEVWATDLTAPGTVPITALVDPFARIGDFHLDGDRAFFTVEDATIGQELFRSDGRPAGTRAVTDFGYHLPFGMDGASIAVSRGRAFFVATDGVGAYRLWLAGDRPETTRSLVADVLADSPQKWIAEAAGSVFVPTYDGESGVHLVVSDGTEEGTREVATGCAGVCAFYPRPLASTASTFYFTAVSAASIQETLYATRPPFHVATELFEALEEGPIIDYATPRTVAILGERVFFAGGQYVPDSYGTGGEPWSTTGTPATTMMVRRLAALESSSEPGRFRTTAGALAFAAGFASPERVMRRSTLEDAVEEVPGDYEPCFYAKELHALAGRFVFEDCDDDFWTFAAAGGPATRLVDLDSDDFSRTAANQQIVGVLRWNGSGYEAWRVGEPEAGSTLAQTLLPEEGYGDLVVAGSSFVLVRDLDSDEQLVGLGPDLTRFDPLSPVFAEVHHYIGSTTLGRGFFGAHEFEAEERVWTTDGSAAGTRALLPPQGWAYPLDALRAGDSWIVLAAVYREDQSELQVWRTDGTPEGSVQLSAEALEEEAEGARLASLPGRYLFTRRTRGYDAGLWAIPAEGGGATALLPAGVTLRGDRTPMSVVSDRLFFTGCDVAHGCELWVTAGTPESTRLFQDIRPGAASSSPEQLFAVDNELVFTADDGLHGIEPWHLVVDGGAPCSAGGGAVCLDDGRYLARVAWKAPVAHAGDASGLPLSPDTGAFWFFDPDNIELIVKAIDGGGTNGHEWIYYGALSNVEYSLDVTDSLTGEAKRYFNPAGRFASAGDILAFPSGAAAGFAAVTDSAVRDAATPPSDRRRMPFGASGSCGANQERFCIIDGRFAVEATWRDFQGRSGTARAGSLTDDTGYFWFFDEANVEIVVKAIDGSAYNGQFWIYFGALSNVEYTIRVTDTVTNTVREYGNSLGRFASFGDIAAFPAD